jgi:hypothetical protein
VASKAWGMTAKTSTERVPSPKDIADRRRVLEKGLLACYEIIDRIRRELAELNEASRK